jgi:hypothetical protein
MRLIEMIFLNPNPNYFNGFRFARLRKSEGVKRIRKFAEKILAPNHIQLLDPDLPRRRMFICNGIQVPVLKPSRQDRISEEAL